MSLLSRDQLHASKVIVLSLLSVRPFDAENTQYSSSHTAVYLRIFLHELKIDDSQDTRQGCEKM